MDGAQRQGSDGSQLPGTRAMGSESEWNNLALAGNMTPPQAGREDGGRSRWASRICSGPMRESTSAGNCFLSEDGRRCPLTGTSQVEVGGMGTGEKG